MASYNAVPGVLPHDGAPRTHTATALSLMRTKLTDKLVLSGSNLNVTLLHEYVRRHHDVNVSIDSEALAEVRRNSQYLQDKLAGGAVIYGVNTGFGGSADVRCHDVEAVQKSLIRLLNAGFGDVFPSNVTRGVMLVRVNSLCRAMSGARPEILQLLTDMLNKDVIPVVPKRGSISASGDLMPTSYIAAAMMGWDNVGVIYNGRRMSASEGLKQAGLKPLVFGEKDGLAVVNSSSFAATVASYVLHDANSAVLLTQMSTALAVEALRGHIESFHPTVHQYCMPHSGQIEVAHNISSMLHGSKIAIMDLTSNCEDEEGTLKQDRYALRTSPQWLGPVTETLKESCRRVSVEINSTNDNPVIDHRNDTILHCGNFQATSTTVAMDQSRQSIQLCGKLLFALMSEVVNPKLNGGLPPNLAGHDINVEFGFKACDIAMASYCAELDWLTHPVSNHVLSAELHNQSVNSLALLSARQSQEAIEILHMMLANFLVAVSQAIDLRFLQRIVEKDIAQLFKDFSISTTSAPPELWPWYNFAFTPERTALQLLESLDNGISTKAFTSGVTQGMHDVMLLMTTGAFTKEVILSLGEGTRQLYSFVRDDLNIRFFDGKRTLDLDLHKVYDAIRDHAFDQVIVKVMGHGYMFGVKSRL